MYVFIYYIYICTYIHIYMCHGVDDKLLVEWLPRELWQLETDNLGYLGAHLGGGRVQGVRTPALSRYSPNCALKLLNQFRRNALKNQFKRPKNPLKHLKNTVKVFF